MPDTMCLPALTGVGGFATGRYEGVHTGHERRVGGRRTRRTLVAAVRGGIWAIPALFALGAVTIAIGLAALEVRLVLPLGGILPSGPAGARSLLSSIITAMISFTALVFSITVVALQLASSQFSPRILGTFLRDRLTQVTLGTFVATFLFAMVVLATLPDRPAGRLPELSLAVSIALVLASTFVFIHYLHHITTIMQVSYLIAAVGAQTRRSIEDQYPSVTDRGPLEVTGPVEQVLVADVPGVVSDVDLDRLADLARRRRCAISVVPIPGDFVVEGGPLLNVHRVRATQPDPLAPADLGKLVSIGVERTPGQDIGFGFRQLADIAERALSPGMNDVTTAVRALQEIHDLLRRLARRPHRPWVVRDGDGTIRARQARRSFDSILTVAVDDVRYAGRDQPRIINFLDAMLRDLDATAMPEHRPAIQRRLRAAPPVVHRW